MTNSQIIIGADIHLMYWMFVTWRVFNRRRPMLSHPILYIPAMPTIRRHFDFCVEIVTTFMVEVRKPPLEGLRVVELAGLAPGIMHHTLTTAETSLN